MSNPLPTYSKEELKRVCSSCKYNFEIHSAFSHNCPIDGNGMLNGFIRDKKFLQEDVPNISVCPCGINRIDCEYHK